MARAAVAGSLAPGGALELRVGVPADPSWGDLAADVGPVLARRAGRPADALAAAVVRHLEDPGGWLARVEVGGPGFVNVCFTPAFWRALLADGLAAGDAWGRTACGGDRRAEVGVLPGAPDPAGITAARAVVLAEATARVLVARGLVVEWIGGECGGQPTADWRVSIRSGCAGDRAVTVGGVRVAPDATATLADAVAVAGADALRFSLLRRPPGAPLDLDLAVAARRGTESPFFSVGYALTRIARLPATSAADLQFLGAAEAPLLRTLVRLPDVVEEAAATAPHALVAFAVELAAAFHGYYNRHRIVTDDPERSTARLALACGVARALRAALALLGIAVPAGG